MYMYVFASVCVYRGIYVYICVYDCICIYICVSMYICVYVLVITCTLSWVMALSVIFSFLTVFLLHTAMMASFNKRQLPAQQTKVVDHGLGPLKAGPTRLCVPVCNHDTASSKPSSVGRDVVDIHQQTKCDFVVNV